jgi:4-amino-4-deoxy-L-arabinose transferase-like glycosyltransferase
LTAAAVPAAPPSRWLLGLTIVVVVAFTVLRLWFAASLDFRSDEAYYWTWSHQNPLSFLDQPPMVAWFERFGQLFFGDTLLGARFGQILAVPMIELLLADIARRRTGSWNAALFVVLALESTIYYALITAIVEPSIPLLLFTSLLLWALCRLDETMDGRWWLLIGVAGGLALLSKYIALLLPPALLVLLVFPQHRRWLRSLWPWAGALITLVLFSPVLIWNAQHDWASFAFQGVRLGTGHALGLGNLIRFVGYDTICAGLLLVPLSIYGAARLAIRAVRERRAVEAALVVAFFFPLLFFVFRSLTLQINQSWAFFMWPIGVLALAISIPWAAALRRTNVLIAAIALPGLPLVTALFLHQVVDDKVWFGAGDPFGQDAGFGQLADDVLAEAKATGATWIATTEYRTYALLLWHIGKQIPVVQVNERARFLDFAPRDPAQFTGKALYVWRDAPSDIVPPADRGAPDKIPLVWRGQKIADFTTETLQGFTPELDPAPASPGWRWN